MGIVTFFFKFFFRNESDVVNNMSEVYPIGTFAQIHEIQDLGDRLRLVVMAHRRIRLLGQIVDDSEAPPGKHVYLYSERKYGIQSSHSSVLYQLR
jgi:hypothetical protein